MTAPLPCGGLGGCGKAPVWFPVADGRGRYHCAHGEEWRATRGPIPQEEAVAEWNKHFGGQP